MNDIQNQDATVAEAQTTDNTQENVERVETQVKAKKSKKPKKKQVKTPKRDISGIFLLDKAQGGSSNFALQQVKRVFQAAKAGHTGALDPMATGLLPICLGEATKFSHYLLDAQKAYQTTIKLGEKTDSADAEGELIEQAAIPALTTESINAVLKQFMGAQKQIPPMYSALKKDGKKLYELARAGIEIEREKRDITIYTLSLVSFDEQSITLEVTCSKGTYIRVLGEDIAQALGTLGHLTMLRRTQTGCFNLEDATTIEQLEAMSTDAIDELLLPTYASINDLPKVMLSEEQRTRIGMGQRLNLKQQVTQVFTEAQCDEIDMDETKEVLMFHDEVFLGLATLARNGRLQPKKVVKA